MRKAKEAEKAKAEVKPEAKPAEKVEAKPQIDGTLIAPLTQGQKVGTVSISVDGKLVKTEPLVVLQAVEPGSWWKRLIDTIRLWFA